MEARGEKQFAITQSDTGPYSALQDTEAGEEKKAKEADRNYLSSGDRSEQRTDVYPLVPPRGTPPDKQKATADSNRLRTELGKEKARSHLEDSTNALRQGQAAGQVSNAPGTTSTSPNGTSNIFGTGGRPVFEDDISSAKGGSP